MEIVKISRLSSMTVKCSVSEEGHYLPYRIDSILSVHAKPKLTEISHRILVPTVPTVPRQGVLCLFLQPSDIFMMTAIF